MSKHLYSSKINITVAILVLLPTGTSFGMFSLNNHQNITKKTNKKPLSFLQIIQNLHIDTEKPLLLLKNEPEPKDELLYGKMLNHDTKYEIAEYLDFKTERAYWCTNKENNSIGRNHWLKREKLCPLLSENLDQCNIKIRYIGSSNGYIHDCTRRYDFDGLTAAIATRSHEKLKLLLQKRENLFFQGIDLKMLPFAKSMSLAKLLARQIVGLNAIEFFESKDHSSIAIRHRNMAAIESLLEHECNLHRISKESFKKFYDIKGYKAYLDEQFKKFLKKIDSSFESSDVEYFKLLVKYVHPDIINYSIERKTKVSRFSSTIMNNFRGTIINNRLANKYTFLDPKKGICVSQFSQPNNLTENACTVLDYVYTACHPYLHDRFFDPKELNWSLINFLRKYGALTYEELMTLPIQQDKNYGFKLPEDYHETGFVFKNEANQTCYWINPNI